MDFELSDKVSVDTNKLVFNNGYAICRDFSLQDIAVDNKFTIEILFKLNSTGSNILSTYTGSDFVGGFRLYVYSSTTIRIYGYPGGSLFKKIKYDSDFPVLISLVYNDGELIVYKDGAVQNNYDFYMDLNDNALLIGAESYNGSSIEGAGIYMDLYALRVYNRALTGEEVYTNFLKDKERFNLDI